LKASADVRAPKFAPIGYPRLLSFFNILAAGAGALTILTAPRLLEVRGGAIVKLHNGPAFRLWSSAN
jgi:hypothetical protein